jgi:FAM91 C-terminus
VTIEDIRRELWSSIKAGEHFEGEMAHIVGVLQSLATLLDTICAAVGGQPVEVIRKESLSALAPEAATRMLQHTYAALVTIELPLPALPVSTASRKGPALFGATAACLTPWLLLAVVAGAKRGPVCLCFPHGQRLTMLPPQARPFRTRASLPLRPSVARPC